MTPVNNTNPLLTSLVTAARVEAGGPGVVRPAVRVEPVDSVEGNQVRADDRKALPVLNNREAPLRGQQTDKPLPPGSLVDIKV